MNHIHMSLNDPKKHFMFVLRLEDFLSTTLRVLNLLVERSIEVDEFSVHTLETGKGKALIHCRMERDRIGRTADLLKKLHGVQELDWMESKVRL